MMEALKVCVDLCYEPKHPEKQPQYRAQRSHTSFLTRMKEHVSSKEAFLQAFLVVVWVAFKYRMKFKNSLIWKWRPTKSTLIR